MVASFDDVEARCAAAAISPADIRNKSMERQIEGLIKTVANAPRASAIP